MSPELARMLSDAAIDENARRIARALIDNGTDPDTALDLAACYVLVAQATGARVVVYEVKP